MTARNPLWTQGGSTSAEEDRALIAVTLPIPGVALATDLAVAQHGTPNMSVDVAAGRVVIAGSESALQSRYIGWLDATQNVVIAASDPTNPRIDLIVARIKDAQYSGASNTFTVEAVTGTPNASPVAPTAPADTYILAQVAVAATVTTIVTANITDQRNGTGDSFPIVTATTLYPASPFVGLGVYRKTNDANEGPEFWNSAAAAWRKPWNTPWGIIPSGDVKVSAAQAAISSGTTDLTGLTLTFTPIANRKYKFSCSLNGATATAVTSWQVFVVKDGTALGMCGTLEAAATADQLYTSGYVTDSPTATSHTYKLSAVRVGAAGSFTLGGSGALSCYFTIEDIGPAGAPS